MAPHCDWKRFQYVLNHDGLQQIHDDKQKTNDRPTITVDILDIISVRLGLILYSDFSQISYSWECLAHGLMLCD
ncbi:hypothetical protein L1987_47059 [Smallanthus sonchifolius]|uniref:Uncharacterized protein n=1 Tax=Smallanthus sonchifolius TaxID=185202 RepID=A0ACB9G217_9ASTR|nr:hypothetical protein L1987_47059 [Smallanthus sonchifolius]